MNRPVTPGSREELVYVVMRVSVTQTEHPDVARLRGMEETLMRYEMSAADLAAIRSRIVRCERQLVEAGWQGCIYAREPIAVFTDETFAKEWIKARADSPVLELHRVELEPQLSANPAVGYVTVGIGAAGGGTSPSIIGRRGAE